MRRMRGSDQGKRLEREKRDKYQGAARVDLEHLEFPSDGLEAIDESNVERLVSLFKRQGCFPDDSRYHIPAIIDHQQLQQAVQASGISPEILLDPTHSECPELRFPPGVRLLCLDGRHRIQAGRAMARPQRWWTVDLYLADLHDDLRLYLAEQISNDRRPSAGKIYYKIRQHDRNPLAQARWWACLEENPRREMERLLRRDDYRAAFDALLDIPGLWKKGLRLGMIKFVLDLKCDEEMLHCLEDIRRFWADLFQNDKRAMRKVDHVTVEALEDQAPGVSSSDAASLFRAVKKGDVFGAFSLEERMRIWARLYTIESIVPTLWAFWENFKYIKACAMCIKKLVKIPSRMTLFGAVERSFVLNSQRKDKTLIQEAEGVFNFRGGLTQDRVALHYRQLFLYVMRHLRELSPKSTKLERAKEKRRKRTATDKAAWYGLVSLAERLGFRSTQTRKLKSKYSSYVGSHSPSELPKPTTVVDGEGECAERRHACPFDLAYEQSRDFLFLDHMHSVDHSQGSGITPFFVRKSVYLAFFGRLESGHYNSDPAAPHPRARGANPSPVSFPPGLPSSQSQTDEVVGQGQGSESGPDNDIHSESQEGQTSSETSEETNYENEETGRVAPEADPDRVDEAQGYIDQIPDMADLFDSPPPSQSLQLYRKPPSIEDVEERTINEDEASVHWDTVPPSILSSSFYSEDDMVEEDAGVEHEVPHETHNLPDHRIPLQEEVPLEGASPVRDTASPHSAADDVGGDAQDRFRFMSWDGENWITTAEYSINTATLSTMVETAAVQYMTQGRYLLDIELWSLHPSQCFEAALANGTHTILHFPAGRICVDKSLAASAAALCPGAKPLGGHTRKRAAGDDATPRPIQKRPKR